MRYEPEYLILRKLYPDYSYDMYLGNEPYKQDGCKAIWKTKYGDGESINDIVVHFSFKLTPRLEVSINRQTVWITDTSKIGRRMVAEYCNKDLCKWHGKVSVQPIPMQMVWRILKTNIKNCAIWDMVVSTATNAIIYEMEDYYAYKTGRRII